MNQPQVCGSVIWCWADHPWPPPGLFGGLSMSPFGVMTRQREAKAPFQAARRLFRARQGLDGNAHDSSRQGTRVLMVRPHMKDVPVAAFPEGYGIRTMSRRDIGLWIDIQRDAERYLEIKDGLFEQEFGYSNAAIQWRSFIVTAPRGLGVGTVSAWYDRDFRGAEYGRIHWVAIRESFQGRGLGKAALAHAMHVLAQWHDRCYLVTSTERVVAIRLYLDFGFEPDLTPSDAREKWHRLSLDLDHPRLRKALAEAGADR
jgi:GNAT superfamily N-acetyltransferase